MITTPHKPRAQKTKLSLGVACARYNGDHLEVLLVRKRITYAYNTFVVGLYRCNDNEELARLFSEMTVGEKNQILSLNFMSIWYHATLSTVNTTLFFKSKLKFEQTFMLDGGRRLANLVSRSPHGELFWEIPKGHKSNSAECNINCAVREFAEETGMTKGNYTIYPATRTYTYSDGGTRYTNIYYFAFTPHKITPRIKFSRKGQTEEVSDIKWMSLAEVSLVDPRHRLTSTIRALFRYTKKYNLPSYCFM